MEVRGGTRTIAGLLDSAPETGPGGGGDCWDISALLTTNANNKTGSHRYLEQYRSSSGPSSSRKYRTLVSTEREELSVSSCLPQGPPQTKTGRCVASGFLELSHFFLSLRYGCSTIAGIARSRHRQSICLRSHIPSLSIRSSYTSTKQHKRHGMP